MIATKRLLLVAPPHMHGSPAFDRAAALAKAMDAALHIVAFDYLEAVDAAGLVSEEALSAVRSAYVERHRSWLEEKAQALRNRGLHVTTEAIWVRQPYKEILLHVQEMGAAMVIKDVQHEPTLKRAFVTPLDWQLLRDCPVPLHLVGHARHARPRLIVAAVDLLHESEHGELNERVVVEALSLALQCDAELHLLYAYDFSAVGMMGIDGLSVQFSETLFESQKQAFQAFAERHGVPEDRRHLALGSPIKAIGSFAEEHQADVMVLGTGNHHGLMRLLGSTAEHVLYQLPCSLLAVKA
jgi:universal stress protein E